MLKAVSESAGGGGGGVTSVNSETGAITLTSTDSTVVISTPTSSTINLASPTGGLTPYYESLGVSSYTDYMASKGLPPAGNTTTHTTNMQRWLLNAQLLAFKARTSVAGNNITQRTYVQAIYPRGGYGPTENTHINCPMVVPSFVALDCREGIIREGNIGTPTNQYTGDTTTAALSNLQQPTFIFPPLSHLINSLDINCNAVGTDKGSGVYFGKNWTVLGVINVVAGGSGYTNGDVLTGFNPDPSPYAPFKVTVTGVDGSGAVTGATVTTAGAYSLPFKLQQIQYTAANATFTGYAILGNVFDVSFGYAVSGGTGTGASFNLSWNIDFPGSGTIRYVNGAALIADTFIDHLSVQQAGTTLDATYGPTFAVGFGSLNYDIGHKVTSTGGYFGSWFNGVADVHGGIFNPVNASIGAKFERGGSVNTKFQIDTPTISGMMIDATSQIHADIEVLNVGSAITGLGTVVIGGDTAFSDSSHRANGLSLRIQTKNVGGTGIPALYLDYMQPCVIDCQVANIAAGGSAVSHPNTLFATFGSNNTGVGQLTGSIDNLTNVSIFSGTVPNDGIFVWDAAAPGRATGGGLYQIQSSSNPVNGTTGLNKANPGSIVTNTTSGALFINTGPSSATVWGSVGGASNQRAVFQLAATTLATGTDLCNWLQLTAPATIVKAWALAKTAPTGQALIFDILRSTNNGTSFTSIWNATPANRIQIAATANAGTQTSFDTTALSAGDVLRIDIIQVGSGTPGGVATVELGILV